MVKKRTDHDKASISIDVFDTFLLRDTTPEIERFYDISKDHWKVLKSYKDITIEDVFFARLLANNIAYSSLRSKKGFEEIRIKEIYLIMLKSLKIKDLALIDRLLKSEIDYEKNHLKPNLDLIKKIKDMGYTKDRIYFISDMYLPKETILEFIGTKAKGFLFKDIYVSSEFSKTKRTGSLFKTFLEKENIDPKCHTHIGDNYVSDYLVPKKLGIDCIHTPRSFIFRLKRKMNSIFFRIKKKDCLIRI